MKKLDELGMWMSEQMFSERGWIDTFTKVGTVIAGIAMLAILIIGIINNVL